MSLFQFFKTFFSVSVSILLADVLFPAYGTASSLLPLLPAHKELAQVGPEVMSCDDPYAKPNWQRRVCKVRQQPFSLDGQSGMIVYVALIRPEMVETPNYKSAFGLSRWRYFYTNDCPEDGRKVPIKWSLEDMSTWSPGWLSCPSEGNLKSYRVIYGGDLKPLFWLDNVFLPVGADPSPR